ncbi:MAG: hypothetical protein JW753_01160 [Dehalococcoidia bacterium]|nr:hypothetical protein [Dehalococcoidia bacterium]
MKRILGVLGLAMVVAAILAIGISGTILAANGDADQGTKTQNQGEVCPCGDCDGGNCEPKDYSYGHNYLEPGPHGLGDAVPASKGTQTQNRGEECPCSECVSGDCEPNDYSHNHNYLEPGPHGK